MPSNRWSRIAVARSGVALAGAALVAAWSLISVVRDRGWEERPSVPVWVDAALADLQPHLRPGEPIAVAVPPLDETTEIAFWYAAQYAVAPALVEPLFVRECLQTPPGPRCALGTATRVAIPRADGGTVGLLRQHLRVHPVGAAGSTVVLEKDGP